MLPMEKRGREGEGGAVGVFHPHSPPPPLASFPQVHREVADSETACQQCDPVRTLTRRWGRWPLPCIFHSTVGRNPGARERAVLCVKQTLYKVGVIYPVAPKTPEHCCPSILSNKTLQVQEEKGDPTPHHHVATKAVNLSAFGPQGEGRRTLQSPQLTDEKMRRGFINTR